ncbi:hypothetical protein ACWDSJ_26180 [Nocardia sp. NPDC003482]
MTAPTPPPPADRPDPAWVTRLLAQIQTLSRHLSEVVSQGYDTSLVGSDASIQAWRAQIHAIAATRSEAETRALALGVGRARVDTARDRGRRGIRPRIPVSADPVRDKMVDGVASDVWQVQHMAAIAAARNRLVRAGELPELDPDVAEQWARTMDALWDRAREVGDAIALTPAEYDGMWVRDLEGWRRIHDVLEYSYDIDGLQERWWVYAWPGIAIEAHRDIAVLGARLARGEVIDPLPIPHSRDMLVDAHQALPPTPTPDRPADEIWSSGPGTDWADPGEVSPAHPAEAADPTVEPEP